MALDHSRDFFGDLAASPTDFSTTTPAQMFRSPDLGHFPFSAPRGWSLGLPMVYLVWIVVVVALYPLCRWYAGVRRRRNDWWLSYL